MDELGQTFCQVVDSDMINLTGENDGRIESLNSEIEVSNCITKQCSQYEFIPKKDNRAFGDITVIINNIIRHINIKMINERKTKAFNGGGPTVFNYILFGKQGTNWNALQKRIKENKPIKCMKKYYYLIYFKGSNKKSIFCSLGDIDEKSIKINPTNPLQISLPITLVKRTSKEEVEFIIGLFEKILKKRAEPWLNYISN